MSTGSVYKWRDYWCASLQVNGRRKTVYAKTKKGAREKLAELQRQFARSGLIPQPGTRTLNDLLDLWLDTIDVREITLANYESNIDRYIRPEFGDLRLNKLQPEQLQRFYNSLENDGLERVPHLVHRILHTALKHAVQWGWIAYNPADRIIPPKWQADRRPVWDLEEMQTFLEGTEGYWLQPVWVLVLTTGVAPLRWTPSGQSHLISG